jgi:hypothetical protein
MSLAATLTISSLDRGATARFSPSFVGILRNVRLKPSYQMRPRPFVTKSAQLN